MGEPAGEVVPVPVEQSRPVAVVTGGGSGIGRACAQILDGQGFAVAALDLDPAAARATTDGLSEALPVGVDVSDKGAVGQAVGQVLDAYGRVDVLVTAAGHLDFAPVETMPESVLDRMLNVHLKGTIFAVQAVLPVMRDRRYGRIVCISSVGARQGHASASHYTAAKAGIIGFANSACRELGPLGVTINCVLPGAVDTPMLARRDQETSHRTPQTPMGHIGTPNDIGYVVAFLASPQARYVSGASIVVGGGAYT